MATWLTEADITEVEAEATLTEAAGHLVPITTEILVAVGHTAQVLHQELGHVLPLMVIIALLVQRALVPIVPAALAVHVVVVAVAPAIVAALAAVVAPSVVEEAVEAVAVAEVVEAVVAEVADDEILSCFLLYEPNNIHTVYE